jgi:hypothetical protein
LTSIIEGFVRLDLEIDIMRSLRSIGFTDVLGGSRDVDRDGEVGACIRVRVCREHK